MHPVAELDEDRTIIASPAHVVGVIGAGAVESGHLPPWLAVDLDPGLEVGPGSTARRPALARAVQIRFIGEAFGLVAKRVTDPRQQLGERYARVVHGRLGPGS